MKNKLSWLAGPYVLWMALVVIVPILLVVVYAFTTSGETAADIGGFTLDNFSRMGTYTVIFARSFQLALVATLVCLLIGYPLAYVMAKEGPGFQRVAMVIIMLPMWVNFLLRTYAWMVYNYLPFMVLPIYSVIIKLDHSLVEAARDLGASSAGVFRRVTLPLSLPGVLSGVTMVFVPSVSTFAISRMMGGNTQMLLGNLIENQFLGGAYNPHLGSAIAVVMMIIVVACMWIMNRFGEGEEQAVIL